MKGKFTGTADEPVHSLQFRTESDDEVMLLRQFFANQNGRALSYCLGRISCSIYWGGEDVKQQLRDELADARNKNLELLNLLYQMHKEGGVALYHAVGSQLALDLENTVKENFGPVDDPVGGAQ